MNNKVYTLLGTVCLFFAGCASDMEEDTSMGSIVGSLSDRTTGELIATANITLSPGGKSAVTGNDGGFSFSELVPGAYTVSVNKEGYKPSVEQIDVQGGKTTEAHLLMERIPSTLTADKQELDFGENPSVTTLSFAIINTGYTDLAFKVETGDCPWLEVDPEADILAHGKTATIVVTINRSLLASGENEAVIVVRSTSGDGNVEVRVSAIGEYRAVSSVNTGEVSDITSTSAILHGEIVNEGAPRYTERGFVYNIRQTPTTDNTIERLSSPVTEDKQFFCRLANLSPSQTYYVRAYVVQNGKIIYGNEGLFNTQQQSAAVSTSAVTGIGATSATFNATITEAGTPQYSEKGFCFARTNNPALSDNKVTVAGGTIVGDYSIEVNGLDAPVTYYVRAYVIQENAVIYGNTVVFATSKTAARVTTSAVSEITGNSATLNGIVNEEGEPRYTQRGFCYSRTNPSPTIQDTKTVETSSQKGSFSKEITGLTEGETYFVRAYVVQDNATIYGNVVSFTTHKLPVVETVAVTNISPVDLGGGLFIYWEARFNGRVVSAGSPTYKQRGFVYGTTVNPTVGINESVRVSGTGTGTFSTIVDNLSNMKTYYVRAYVKTDSGDYIYGESVRFSTMK